jgi:hypothetical protein
MRETAMRFKGKTMGCLLLVMMLLAPVAMAGPVDAGWWGWWSSAWESVVRLVAGNEEPEPEPPVVEVPEDGEQEACSPLIGCPESDGGPSMDPNG